MSTTFERLCAILAKDFRLAPDRLSLDAPLEGLGIDSLGTVELLWTLEEAFLIKWPPDAVNVATLGDVVHCVDQLVAAKGLATPPAAPGTAGLHMT